MAQRTRPTVSDTAHWVAAYRARESARPDALFYDPFAARLAGELGERMARNAYERWIDTSWPVIARTHTIDEFILRSLDEGVDRVINLAAGLDCRPYRMRLPRELLWVEADLPAMVEEKTRVLAGEQAVCELRREKVDLSKADLRRAFLDRAVQGARRALVLTEGLLVYLDDDSVRGIARDLAARPEIAFWIHDLQSPPILKVLKWTTSHLLGETAQMRFGPKEGVAFFRPFGWEMLEARSMLHDAARIGRLPLFLQPVALFPPAKPEHPGNRPWSAVVRYGRPSS